MTEPRTPFENFECDNCGACCRQVMPEADWFDALREPKLFQIQELDEGDKMKLRNGETCIRMYAIDRGRCCFLDDNNRCQIYATRPHECVAVEPGDAKCQQARRMEGLGTLRDKHGRVPSLGAMIASCDEYLLDCSVWRDQSA